MALPGFNDLGHNFDDPYFFPEIEFIYNYLHVVQNLTKNQCGKLKKFKISAHRTLNPATLRLQGV